MDLCTLEEWMASVPPQQFGQEITYAVGTSDGATGSRRVCGFRAPQHLARPWAITLGPPSRTIPSAFPAAAQIEMSSDINEGRARLQWGNGGFMSTIDVDWRQGSQFVVCGCAVELATRMPIAPDIAVTIGGHIAPAWGAIQNRATLSDNLGLVVAAGGTADVSVPRGAYAVEFLIDRGNPLTSIPYTLEWFRPDNTGVANMTFPASANRIVYDQAVPAPVPTSATWCRFTNQSGGANGNPVWAVWHLAF